MATRTYSEELKQTLIDHPGISHVHFAQSGEHYFNVHKDDSNNGKLYGRTERTPVSNEAKSGIKDGTTIKNIGVPSTMIIDSVAREVILSQPAAQEAAQSAQEAAPATTGAAETKKEEKKS